MDKQKLYDDVIGDPQKTSSSSFSSKNFINQESIGGILLMITAAIAIVWANSSFYDSYHWLWRELEMGFSFGDFELSGNLHHWINDGLMAVFFFTIGLEVKREIMIGGLSTPKKAFLPIMGAIGGMVIPALFFVFINKDNPDNMNGWGIPMATDIAFSLGILALLGSRAPMNLKIFLTALAIADDLGAILVIAIFYTDEINFAELLNGGIFIGVLLIANFLKVRNTTFYGVVGLLGVWLSFLFSGVHATIAGVLIALTIPVHTKISRNEFVRRLKIKTLKLDQANTEDEKLHTKDQAHLIDSVSKLTDDVHTPLQQLEHSLHPIVIYFILPLFALSNAGVHIEGSIIELLMHPVSIGIIFGLVLGKFLGISVIIRILVKLKMAVLPENVTWRQIYGMSFLAGIGFTMSIFIAELAFSDPYLIMVAKVGIIFASVLSALFGVAFFMLGSKKTEA
jgi:NhaA family Na+:H+ antiporter